MFSPTYELYSADGYVCVFSSRTINIVCGELKHVEYNTVVNVITECDLGDRFTKHVAKAPIFKICSLFVKS